MPKLLHLVKSLFRIEIYIFSVTGVGNCLFLDNYLRCQFTVQCMTITNLMIYCTVLISFVYIFFFFFNWNLMSLSLYNYTCRQFTVRCMTITNLMFTVQSLYLLNFVHQGCEYCSLHAENFMPRINHFYILKSLFLLYLCIV